MEPKSTSESDSKQLLHDCYDAVYPVIRDFLQKKQHPDTQRADAKTVIGLAHELAMKTADEVAKSVGHRVGDVQQAPSRPHDFTN